MASIVTEPSRTADQTYNEITPLAWSLIRSKRGGIRLVILYGNIDSLAM